MMNRGLGSIKRYAAGGTIVQNADGTASLVHPVFGVTHSVGGPNAAALLAAAYPAAQLATGSSAPTSSGSSAPTSSDYSDSTSSGSSTPQTNAKELLDRVYTDVLGRKPTQIGYDFYLPKIISGELNANNIIPAVTGGATSGGDKQAAIDFALQTNLREFDNRIASGDFTGAKSILDQSINQYYLDPTASYANIAEYLNKDPKFANIIAANEGQLFDVDDIRDFGSSVDASGTNTSGEKKIKAGMDDPLEDPGTDFVQAVVTDEDGNILSGPPDKVIPGIPRFARQTPSDLTFAPLRRGLAQLRPAMSMPGLTSGQAAFGGPASVPGQPISGGVAQPGTIVQNPDGTATYTFPGGGTHSVGGPNAASLLANAYPNATLAGAGQPSGNLVTPAPTTPFALPEDFALQTGAYGAPTPTFLALPEKNTATSAAETPFPSGSIQGTDYTQNPIIGYTDVGTPIYSSTAPVSTDREGGLIKMAEGGEPPKMAELSAMEAGSTFDISKYIDDEGRLVGGYSKPIYDENRVITGYDYRPYERDVVFGKELREKEAAMRLTDAEREQMMVEMAMRQGRTGIDPRVGGLAGIEIGDPMMRRRPQYYSTVEQFRPRYAEGGLASVAQNLADKGRKGDSMLVHMTPDEVAGLQALAQQMGGSLTINPQTGLPEANIFKKLLPMALGFALGPAGFGVFQSALTAGLAVGAGYTLATGSLQQGISAGLGAYGGSNLGTGLQAAGAEAATNAAASEAASTAATDVAAAAGGDAASAAMVDISALPPGTEAEFLAARPEFGQATSDALGGRSLGSFATELPETVLAPGMGDPSSMSALELAETAPTAANTAYIPPAPTAPRTPGSAFTGLERSLSGDKATRDLAAADYAAETGSTLGTSALQIMGGAAGQSAADAERAVKAQQAAIVAKKDEQKRRFDALFGRTFGTLPARSGGLMKLAGGGMTYMEAGGTTGPTGTPRDVTGTGDGMSDSVPASIEGVQEARLADGEFVIPADVVADIGNGSSDAGSKKLYDMMDRIRKARHGTTEQPPEIQAERLMPA
jgi:hypothetical protein